MNTKKVYRGALVAFALALAGCSSTGTEGRTSVPGQQAPSKQSAHVAAETRQSAVTKAAQKDRQAMLEQAARVTLQDARGEQTKLNEAARARLAEATAAAQAERQARLNEAATTRLNADSTP